jgi:hypothetical protein
MVPESRGRMGTSLIVAKAWFALGCAENSAPHWGVRGNA